MNNMDNVITVKITPEDRMGANFEAPQGCPLAKALARMFPKSTIFVFDDRVKIDAVKYSFNEKEYSEKLVNKAKKNLDMTVVLNKIMKNEKANREPAGATERIK
jgi:hypothetical protein